MSYADDVLTWLGLTRIADSDVGAAVNPWSGAAGGAKVTDTRPGSPAWLSAEEIDWLVVTDGLARRLVYGPVEDALGRGWRTDTPDDRDATREIDGRLDLERRVSEALASARQYGGAWVWPVTDDDADLSEPLPSGEHAISAVHVVDQREARPFRWDQSTRSGRFTRPEVLDVSLRREDVTAHVGLVHASRLIYVPGLPLSRSQHSPPQRRGYDLAVPQAYWEALRDLLLSHGSAAGLVVEKSMPWVRLARRGAGDAAGRSSFRDNMGLWARMRSSWGVTVLGDGDEVGRLDAQLSGVRDVLLAGYERISAIEGIPLSALIGSPPAGLSTDDAAGRRSYSRLIGRMRRLTVDPVLRRIYEIELGPARREIVWPPVDPPTEAEALAGHKARAEVAQILTAIGAYTGEEVREQFAAADPLDVPPRREDLDAPLDDDDPEEQIAADAETYAVPASARNNAAMVLRWRREHPDEIEGMTEVGWGRARQLAGQARVGRDTVAAMSGFARHRKSYEAARARDPDKPWTEPAIVAWLGWGGSSGIDWARRITGAAGD